MKLDHYNMIFHGETFSRCNLIIGWNFLQNDKPYRLGGGHLILQRSRL